MAVPPAPDGKSGLTPENQSSTHDPHTAHGVRRIIAAVLVAMVVAAGGAAVWQLVQRSGDSGDVAVQREKVMAQAQTFIKRVNTYGPDLLADDGTMPEYRAGVEEVITPKFAESFEESVPAAEATVAQAGFSRVGEVFGAGVSAIDDDSATALVAGSFLNSYPDPKDETKRVDDVPLPFRVEIKLVKIDGTWLVDSFTPITGDPAQPETSGSPSPSPTDSATPSEKASQ